ncbi:hypothetical protein NEIELOOT_01022 [Neisseria elongata subsp. glycolytica ATCC 29315]|uniref:Uncharacterized protein n=1 Tax=Neisseria elongata subsp. glycolytica ATCC 29315 TaxID=546263 RepID=D4DPN5_NEIEG|nr:hypothetical protein NEIELOOT_01022 [Neisseria elongata subsp. glycolytica ATCC 29315]
MSSTIYERRNKPAANRAFSDRRPSERHHPQKLMNRCGFICLAAALPSPDTIR